MPAAKTMDELEQLRAQLAQMQTLLDEKDKIIEQQGEKVKSLVARGVGWLVTTKQADYNGIMFGEVEFVNGQAWIGASRKVRYFEWPALTEDQLAKFPETERKAIREREKVSSAERAVKCLQYDFGYEALYFDAEHSLELQSRIDERAKERARLEDAKEARKQVENIEEVGPARYLGG